VPHDVVNGDSVVNVAASATDPSTVYALLSSGMNGAILKSTDKGVTWKSITGDFPTSASGYPGNYPWNQYYYDSFIGVTPFLNLSTNKYVDAIYVGEIDAMVSINSSGHWISLGGPAYTANSVLHTDMHALAVNPSDWHQILIGSDAGVFKGVLKADES